MNNEEIYRGKNNLALVRQEWEKNEAKIENNNIHIEEVKQTNKKENGTSLSLVEQECREKTQQQKQQQLKE